MSRWYHSLWLVDHGAIAPSSSDRSESGTTSSGSTSKRVPRPAQWGHAPYGELKEKLRGASSSNDTPQLVQARCCENTIVSASASASSSPLGTSCTSATDRKSTRL